MIHSIRWALVFTLFAASALAGEVSILLYDDTGHIIPEGTIEVYELDDDYEPRKRPLMKISRGGNDPGESFEFELPNGEYEMRVKLDGFRTRIIDEDIGPERVVVRTVLELGVVSSYAVEYRDDGKRYSLIDGQELRRCCDAGILDGTVTGRVGEDGRLWATLTAFLDANEALQRDTYVDGQGRFTFGWVGNGLYVLNIFEDRQGEGVPLRSRHSELIAARGQTIEIRID